MTQEQFNKLPKAVQTEINRLRQDNESLTKELNTLTGSYVPKSENYISYNRGLMDGYKAIDAKNVRFGKNIEVRMIEGGIEVRNNEGYSISIHPKASNSIEVKF